MPDALLSIDWVALEAERDKYLLKHRKFREAMNIELAAAHVTPLDMDSLDAPDPDVCQQCNGRGWFTATDSRRPWREYRTECECAI